MSGKFNRLVYLFFRMLLNNDIWRVFFGVLGALVLVPRICETKEDIGLVGEVVVWIMVITSGWALAELPANKISKKLQEYVKNFYNNSVL